MRNKDDLPETPDWTAPVKPWDERTCSKSCVCESAQHAVFMHGDNVILGEN